jgi:putative peptide maturation dehydrogenase
LGEERLSRQTAVKRPTHQCVFFRESLVPDLRALFRGRLASTTLSECVGVSLLTGEEHPISEAELVALGRVPSERWTDVSALGAEASVVDSLVDKALLLSDGDDPSSVELRDRDAKLARQCWYPYAAVYHFMSKWRGARQAEDDASDVEEYGERLQAALEAYLEAHEPPPHFHRIAQSEARATLPAPRGGRDLYRVLAERKTQRVFDRTRALELGDLSELLYYVYGCHGLSAIGAKLSVVKKTSPSGGSMHPIEVYPLVMRVGGLERGLYHYDVAGHALERIQTLSLGEAESLAAAAAAGQMYVRDAAALFLLTARFDRTFWKYREHAKAYRVVLMDAAHLSQTFYLVCAELGLGAFFTTAINEHDIEGALGLDDVEEGALAISGCGLPDPSPRRAPFEHGPYRFPAG